MKIFFDKENYVNYLKSYDESEVGPDTMRMVKKQLNVHLNFKPEDLDEYESILLNEFQTGVSTEFKFTHSNNLVSRPLNKNSFPSNNGIYLLKEDNIDNVKNLHTILIGNLNEEVDTLSQLIIKNDYSFHLEKGIGKEITSTNHFDILNFPFSTLLIIDRFMFKGPETGGNLSLFDFNLAHILKKSFNKKKGNSQLIFIYQINVKVAKSHPLYDEGPDFDKIASKIKNLVHKHCPKPDIFFIGVPSGYIEDEHDRFLISNYLRIKSGDSLIYFDSIGNIKTMSSTVDFYSHGDRDYRMRTESLLQKIKGIIKDTLDNHPRYSKIPTWAIKDNIINFS